MALTRDVRPTCIYRHLLALHPAVCDRSSRQCDHQGRNAQNEKELSELLQVKICEVSL
jgi:hypothetical protein